MRQDKWNRPFPFFGLKLRHAVALLVCLGLILVLAGYFSVNVGQKAAFKAVTAQGRALTESLLSSAQIIIEADDEFTAEGIDRLSAGIAGFTRRIKSPTQGNLDSLRQMVQAEKIYYMRKQEMIAVSSGKSVFPWDDIKSWLDSLEIDPETEIIYEFRQDDTDRYLWAYFPYDKEKGIFLVARWLYGQYGNSNLGLSYLLNQVARESGVEYIMLQNLDGIIFASKKVASMPRISDDPFLGEALKSDTTCSRLIIFQDREILETTRRFESREFEGLFRVGLSMFGYREITDGMKSQVWLMVAALIMLGMLAFGVVVGFQNFDLLKAGLDKADIISRNLLDSIPGPVIAVDRNLIITDINSAARSSFGLQSLRAGTDYRGAFRDDPFRFDPVVRNMRIAGFEGRVTDSGNRYFITSTPLIGSDGELIGAIAIAQDITDTRRLEEIAESRRRLSELGALAASMAHEIRNPLNAIGITIQRMKNEIRPKENSDEYDRFIDGLKMEISRLNSIIEKFLAVARSVRPEIADVDIEDLISRAVDLFRTQAEARKIVIDWKAGSSDTIIQGDKDGLTQALINIIKNSIEALQREGRIEIGVARKNDKIIISISDNGPGMEDTGSALKPFHTTKKDGTGLGLSTASKILTDHGGELAIESAPGRGCRVDMIIPLKRGSQ